MSAVTALRAHRPESSWKPVDLRAVLAADYAPPRPVRLRRDDGHPLLYAGMLHLVIGESEAFKSWLALVAAMEQINAARPVLYVDFESTPDVACSRLLALGCPREHIAAGLTYVQPQEPFSGATVEDLAPHVREDPPALVVFDGLNEGLALHGLDMNSATDIGTFYRLLPRRLALTGASVLLLDHPVKDRETRGRWASGSQHKVSGVDVAYTLEAVRPFGVGLHGISRLRISKDRPGAVRGAALDGWLADLHLRSERDGSVLAELHPPRDSAEVFRPTRLMEAVSLALEEAREGLSTRALRGAVHGKDVHKDYAVELLVGEGYVGREAGPCGASLHRSVRPFRAGHGHGQEEVE
ncbi:MAG: AAA family ATPase [Actinomycetota bacterium]|nr:AAA family ATPase [Actinomycetota bacterium]